MNEELRSSAEELETSKEELQSVNEELTTVNQELKIKIEELGLANNDFQNLINSSDIGTIFLDRALRVKLFTPPRPRVFNLLPADLGRPLADITSNLALRPTCSTTCSACSRSCARSNANATRATAAGSRCGCGPTGRPTIASTAWS